MENKDLVPVFEGPLNEFPSMKELPEGVKSINLEDTFGYSVDFVPGVVYAQRSGET